MPYDNLKLLTQIIAKPNEKKANFDKLDEMIRTQIPLYNDIPDFEALYSDLMIGSDKFKHCILYEDLIGKNIVALGGMLSSGKTSFLNTFNSDQILADDIDPETSVPTYIVYKDKHKVSAVNIFENVIELETQDVIKISHGIGEMAEHMVPNVTLGHMLESVLIQSPNHNYIHTAFLDTTGYVKPYSSYYTAKTDELFLRSQLNSSDFVLWFVSAEAELITQSDLDVIKSLRSQIPLLIIVNKADTKSNEQLVEICENIKLSLDSKGINYIDVLTFSSLKPKAYDSNKIRHYMDRWDNRIYLSDFAKHLKVLFKAGCDFYSDNLDESSAKELKSLQNEFFTEINKIADSVGLYVTKPDQIDLIQNPFLVVSKYKQNKKIRTNPKIADLLAQELFDTKQWSQQEGGSEYTTKIISMINELTSCEEY